jgi:hypothetical protein
MIRTIAAALAALALVSFGVRADEPAKTDAPATDKKMDKADKKAHKKAKKAKKAAAPKPADTTAPAAK